MRACGKGQKKIKFLDLDFCVPSYEDILFISLVNMARNLRNATSEKSVLYTFFDCKYLLENKNDFDWKIVFENAKITKTQISLWFALFFIERLMPDVFNEIPFKITDKEKEQLEEYSLKVMYNRIYLDKLRQESKKIKIKNALLSKDDFIEYIKIKPKYFLLKSVRNSSSVFFKRTFIVGFFLIILLLMLGFTQPTTVLVYGSLKEYLSCASFYNVTLTIFQK